MKHPVLATFAAAGTLAAIVAAYQRGARVYQEMVDRGEIDPLTRLNTVPRFETFDNRPITDLALPAATPLSGYTNLYRIPDNEPGVGIPTPFGSVRLQAADGYFRGTGIFVYFPAGIGFGKKQTHDIMELVAKRLFEGSNGRFHFDQNPGSSMGGNNTATGLITAGRDYDAYRRYHGQLANELDGNGRKKYLEYQGYFKCSDAPRVQGIALHLSQILGSLDSDDILELTSITEDYARNVLPATEISE